MLQYKVESPSKINGLSDHLRKSYGVIFPQDNGYHPQLLGFPRTPVTHERFHVLHTSPTWSPKYLTFDQVFMVEEHELLQYGQPENMYRTYLWNANGFVLPDSYYVAVRASLSQQVYGQLYRQLMSLGYPEGHIWATRDTGYLTVFRYFRIGCLHQNVVYNESTLGISMDCRSCGNVSYHANHEEPWSPKRETEPLV